MNFFANKQNIVLKLNLKKTKLTSRHVSSLRSFSAKSILLSTAAKCNCSAFRVPELLFCPAVFAVCVTKNKDQNISWDEARIFGREIHRCKRWIKAITITKQGATMNRDEGLYNLSLAVFAVCDKKKKKKIKTSIRTKLGSLVEKFIGAKDVLKKPSPL